MSSGGIIEPGAELHTYKSIPINRIALEETDLVLYNGYNLELILIQLMKVTEFQCLKSTLEK